MQTGNVLKSVIITIVYYLLTVILSITMYLTIGTVLMNSNPTYVGIIDTFVYLILAVISFLYLKKQKAQSFKKSSIKINWSIVILVFSLALCYRIAIDPIFRWSDISNGDLVFKEVFMPKNFETIFIIFINTVILTPIVEEIVFRRILFKALYENTGKWSSILISSFLFALIHIKFYPFSFDITSFLNAFLIGIITCLIYLRYKLVYAILFHIAFNLIWFLVTYIHFKDYHNLLIKLKFGVLYWVVIALSILLLSYLINSIKKRAI